MGAAATGFALLFALIQISGGSAAAVVGPTGEVDQNDRGFVPGELVVGFTKGSDSEQIDDSLEAIDAEDSESVPGLSKTRLVEIDEDDDVVETADELDDQTGVRWAEPNYVIRTQSLPNDPRLGLLWGLRNVGQNSQLMNPQGDPVFGIPGVDIGAPSAWKKSTGSNRNIAIIDTGIDGSHPDLGSNLNRKLSRNFVPTPGPGDPFDWPVDPKAWTDQHFHGTHVAGTVGAVGNNGLGVTGVNWKTRLVAVRTNGLDGEGTSAAVAAAFAYVGRKGIPIANVSLGGPASVEEIRAITEAARGSRDTLFVVAAGNEEENNDEVPSFPCNIDLPNILCVAAIDSRAKMADFSNYGRKSVDVAAPGVDIESTWVNQTFPFTNDYENGIGAFDQQPYPWKLEVDQIPRLVFDGRDGGVDSPVAEASATLEDPIDLTGQSYCRLDLGRFAYESFLELEGNQTFSFEYRVDGGSWMPVPEGEITAQDLEDVPEGTPLTFPLPGADGASEVQLSFVFRANGTLTPLPLILLGPMTVQCQVPLPPGGLYNAISGTSMASPHVAGVAGLVKSVAPKAGPEKLKKIIMRSVVPTKSLKGKTVTGGRVDAGRAVRFIRPANRARLHRLKVSPKKLRLRPGQTGRLRVRVRNGGGATAKQLRICVKGPGRLIRKPGCTKGRKLGWGKTAETGIRIRPKGRARAGHSIRLKVVARVKGAKNRSTGVQLKVKRK